MLLCAFSFKRELFRQVRQSAITAITPKQIRQICPNLWKICIQSVHFSHQFQFTPHHQKWEM
jgi:hypothetical protein